MHPLMGASKNKDFWRIKNNYYSFGLFARLGIPTLNARVLDINMWWAGDIVIYICKYVSISIIRDEPLD